MEKIVDIDHPKPSRVMIRKDLSLSWMKRVFDGSQHPALDITDPRVVFSPEKDAFERSEDQKPVIESIPTTTGDPPIQTHDENYLSAVLINAIRRWLC